jgi:hypothetical protein
MDGRSRTAAIATPNIHRCKKYPSLQKALIAAKFRAPSGRLFANGPMALPHAAKFASNFPHFSR